MSGRPVRGTVGGRRLRPGRAVRVGGLLAALAAGGGCRSGETPVPPVPASGPDSASPASALPGGIGAPCRTLNDCLAGAECSYGRCVPPMPCTATTLERRPGDGGERMMRPDGGLRVTGPVTGSGAVQVAVLRRAEGAP